MKKIVAIPSLFLVAVVLGFVVLIATLGGDSSTDLSGARQYTYTVVNTYPHDVEAFTEGLVYIGGSLYEGTGLLGQSLLRRVDLISGAVLTEVLLPAQDFGEGITVVGDSIVQLTWQSHVGFIYERDSLTLTGNFSYAGEGWGLAFDGERLIMSNGSDVLTLLDPETFQRIGQIQVLDGNTSVSMLNELEYVKGDIYANVFQQRQIAIIEVETGQIKGWVDLSGLEGASTSNSEAVLNGIAYDAEDDRLFVTGKYWPYLYQIELVPLST